MIKSNFDKYSTDELIKRRNLLKGVLTGTGIVWLVLLATAIYFYISKDTVKLFFPLAVLPATLLPGFILVKSLSEEIKVRKEKV